VSDECCCWNVLENRLSFCTATFSSSSIIRTVQGQMALILSKKWKFEVQKRVRFEILRMLSLSLSIAEHELNMLSIE
jgi:hypothetical protein